MSQFLRNYIAKRYGKTFMINVDQHADPVGLAWSAIQGTSIIFILETLKKNPFVRFEDKRLQATKQPGIERHLKQREIERTKNRAEVNFYCRYILAKKKKVLPLS